MNSSITWAWRAQEQLLILTLTWANLVLTMPPLARASAVIDPNLQMGKLRVRQGKLLNVVQSAIYLTSSPYSTEVPDSANKVP